MKPMYSAIVFPCGFFFIYLFFLKDKRIAKGKISIKKKKTEEDMKWLLTLLPPFVQRKANLRGLN